ncbi:M23 family metallopeptidase [Rhodococcus sp. (in: high G+C Gram-positive bacteria)]|uniref:M23 family metallopeptidase n=1 Tax=Rhodococcus sp. TaxID=1831 RepID=UPI00388FCABA
MRIATARRIVSRSACLAVLVFTAGTVPAHGGPLQTDRSHAGQSFGWPLDPRPAVTRAFDPPDRNWLPGHRGVDLAASPGQDVRSAGDGVVVFAGTVAGKPVVSVDHPGGLRTTYEPVVAAVVSGRRIGRGDPIGTVESGHEGCPVAACLHWGLRRDRDDYLDPLPLVERPVIRLHPV